MWLVGSSRIRKFGARSDNRTNNARARSPPLITDESLVVVAIREAGVDETPPHLCVGNVDALDDEVDQRRFGRRLVQFLVVVTEPDLRAQSYARVSAPRNTPISSRMNVDLPTPLAPSSATRSPGRIRN